MSDTGATPMSDRTIRFEILGHNVRLTDADAEARGDLYDTLEIPKAEWAEIIREWLSSGDPSRPSVSKEPCGELVEKLRQAHADLENNCLEDSADKVLEVISALQSSSGAEENWIDELGYYVQYAFDHCDELMERFYPSIENFEFDEFYMSKSLCRLQVTPVCTAASMSLVIPTPDYIEWVQTLEDSNNG